MIAITCRLWVDEKILWINPFWKSVTSIQITNMHSPKFKWFLFFAKKASLSNTGRANKTCCEWKFIEHDRVTCTSTKKKHEENFTEHLDVFIYKVRQWKNCSAHKLSTKKPQVTPVSVQIRHSWHRWNITVFISPRWWSFRALHFSVRLSDKKRKLILANSFCLDLPHKSSHFRMNYRWFVFTECVWKTRLRPSFRKSLHSAFGKKYRQIFDSLQETAMRGWRQGSELTFPAAIVTVPADRGKTPRGPRFPPVRLPGHGWRRGAVHHGGGAAPAAGRPPAPLAGAALWAARPPPASSACSRPSRLRRVAPRPLGAGAAAASGPLWCFQSRYSSTGSHALSSWPSVRCPSARAPASADVPSACSGGRVSKREPSLVTSHFPILNILVLEVTQNSRQAFWMRKHKHSFDEMISKTWSGICHCLWANVATVMPHNGAFVLTEG